MKLFLNMNHITEPKRFSSRQYKQDQVGKEIIVLEEELTSIKTDLQKGTVAYTDELGSRVARLHFMLCNLYKQAEPYNYALSWSLLLEEVSIIVSFKK